MIYIPEEENNSDKIKNKCSGLMSIFKLSSESKQNQICDHIKNIANINIKEKNDIIPPLHSISPPLHSTAHDSKFIIGIEVQNQQSAKSRYFQVFFLDVIRSSPNLRIGTKKGILEVNANGELSILDDDFNPMKNLHADFIFENNKLELHWLENNEKNSICRIS